MPRPGELKKPWVKKRNEMSWRRSHVTCGTSEDDSTEGSWELYGRVVRQVLLLKRCNSEPRSACQIEDK
jgi:hypothetical protein